MNAIMYMVKTGCDNLSTKWTIWHFYGDKKSIIPALVQALQYP